MPTTLKSGDSGPLVKRLQVALIGFGYDLGLAGPDGNFGERTQAAVASFQDSRGLPNTGIADPATIAAMDLDPDTLDDLIEIDSQPSAGNEQAAAPLIATVAGDDVYLDPPMRLWPQYDTRWKHERIAGPKTGRLLDWITNGCNASVAAMTLRWFAEDCSTGTIPFPTKPNGSIDPSWYGLRMGEAFWPNADPPGKVALTPDGRIDFRKLYSVAAHYLKTGEIQRSDNGDVADPSDPKAYYVTRRSSDGWLAIVRELLKAGPVILGIGAPAGHFVLAHGLIGGALVIADPGGVLYQAHNGGTAEIANWQDKDGYLDGTTDRAKVRMPAPSQWPDGSVPGEEGDGRSYNLISGSYLNDLIENLISVTSLTYPEGATF